MTKKPKYTLETYANELAAVTLGFLHTQDKFEADTKRLFRYAERMGWPVSARLVELQRAIREQGGDRGAAIAEGLTDSIDTQKRYENFLSEALFRGV